MRKRRAGNGMGDKALEGRPVIRSGLRLTALPEEEAQIAGSNAGLHAEEVNQFSLNARMPPTKGFGLDRRELP